MNKERILELADVVEQEQYKFNGITAALNMNNWFEHVSEWEVESQFREYALDRDGIPNPQACNTTACIAGFACLLFDYEEANQAAQKTMPLYNPSRKAAQLLGLTAWHAERLFCSNTSSQITGHQAAKVLRHLADVGTVDWSVAYD